MKIISELRKQAIRDLHNKLGYSQNQIVAIFHEGSISKPTVAKILREEKLNEKKISVDENFHDSAVTIEPVLSSSSESDEIKISEVKPADSVESGELNDVVYTDWEFLDCEEFLEKRHSTLKYSKEKIMDLANAMVKAGKEKKITAAQIIKVADEILEHDKPLHYENLLKAVDLCKKHNII